MFFKEGRNINDPISINEFIKTCNITMTVREGKTVTGEKDPWFIHEVYVLRIEDERGKRDLELPISRGKFGKQFSTAEVVDMFLVDTQATQLVNFDDWAKGAGYNLRNEDQRYTAYAEHSRLVDQGNRFSEWLPSDLTPQSIEPLAK